MKKLVLSEEESQKLLKDGAVEIERNGFPLIVTPNKYFDKNAKDCWYNREYDIVIINIYDKVILKDKKVKGETP